MLKRGDPEVSVSPHQWQSSVHAFACSLLVMQDVMLRRGGRPESVRGLQEEDKGVGMIVESLHFRA